MSKSRKVTVDTKNYIARMQSYKCANKPNSNLRGLENYLCPAWNGPNQGHFDMAGYEIDHIIERCMSEDDNEYNLHALCPNCHSCKTRWFRHNMKQLKKDYYDGILSDTEISKSEKNIRVIEESSFDEERPKLKKNIRIIEESSSEEEDERPNLRGNIRVIEESSDEEKRPKLKKNQCARCFKIFSDRSHYLQHKKRKTLCEKGGYRDEPQEKHTCEACQKEFPRIYDFTRHMVTRKHAKNVEKIRNRATKRENSNMRVTVKQILEEDHEANNL